MQLELCRARREIERLRRENEMLQNKCDSMLMMQIEQSSTCSWTPWQVGNSSEPGMQLRDFHGELSPPWYKISNQAFEMIIYGSALGVNIETDRRSLEWISGGTNFLIVILRLNCFSTFNPEDDPPPDTIHIGRLNTAKYTSVETYQIQMQAGVLCPSMWTKPYP